MNIAILDTETTGIDNSEVVEIALMGLAADLTPTGETLYARHSHTKPMALGAVAAHHLLPEDLEGQPIFNASSLPSLTYMIGHNVDFDWKAIGSPPQVKRICTLALARRTWPNLDSYSQSALLYHLHGQTPAVRDRLRNAHSALVDIEICLDILRAICDNAGITDIEQLYAASEAARIPTVMGFGKYKGTAIKDVPRDYVLWYRRQTDPDPFYLQAFKDAGK